MQGWRRRARDLYLPPYPASSRKALPGADYSLFPEHKVCLHGRVHIGVSPGQLESLPSVSLAPQPLMTDSGTLTSRLMGESVSVCRALLDHSSFPSL